MRKKTENKKTVKKKSGKSRKNIEKKSKKKSSVCLNMLLDNNSSIKQLEFQQNMFGVEGLFEFLEMLGRNTSLYSHSVN